MAHKRPWKAYLAEFLLLLVGIIWGATFPVVKIAIETTGALWFNALRFALAGAIALVIILFSSKRISREMVVYGVLLGGLLAIAYTTQTIGLMYTTSGNAGFITGLFVVFVPLVAAVSFRRIPSPASIFSVSLAVLGLALLSLNSDLTISRGDLLVLICAFVYSVHIVILDRVTDRFSSLELAMIQIVAAGVLMNAFTILLEPRLPAIDGYAIFAILLTAIFATVAAFFVQTFAQKHIGPTRTALILITEPVFAAVFGYLLLQEILSPRKVVGAAILLSAMIISELFGKAKHEEDQLQVSF